MRGIKEAVLKIDDYFVKQDFSRIKLNQNESPSDIPTEIKEKILKNYTISLKIKIRFNSSSSLPCGRAPWFERSFSKNLEYD